MVKSFFLFVDIFQISLFYPQFDSYCIILLNKTKQHVLVTLVRQTSFVNWSKINIDHLQKVFLGSIRRHLETDFCSNVTKKIALFADWTTATNNGISHRPAVLIVTQSYQRTAQKFSDSSRTNHRDLDKYKNKRLENEQQLLERERGWIELQ